MPLYEYKCTGCEDVLEVYQKVSDEKLLTCPVCFEPVDRLVSMSSFHLKGGGWYKDAYSKPVLNRDCK